LTTTNPPLHWGTTIFLFATPVIALIGIPWYIVVNGVSLFEIVFAFLLWYAIGIAITAGYHRLFSHRSYDAPAFIRLLFLIFGAAAIQTSALKWSFKHRKHHNHVDTEPDPYNITRGFWYAHIGWILHSDVAPIDLDKVKDLTQDPLVMWQHRWYYAILILVALGLPLLAGILSGHILGCLLIACVGRIVLTHHVTFFINSLCHMIGRQPYSLKHSARDSAIMAVLSFGEGYHNYHHTFPFDYRNGIKSWHLDPAKWLIAVFEQIGLAQKVQRTNPLHVLKAKALVEYERIAARHSTLAEEKKNEILARASEAYESLQHALKNYFEVTQTNRSKLFENPSAVKEIRMAFQSAQGEWRRTVKRMLSAPLPSV